MVEHCVSGAKGCGFNSQGTHILTKNVYEYTLHYKLLLITASAKCINVNINVERSFFCSSRLHLFDQKNIKINNIVKYYCKFKKLFLI